VQHSGDGAVVNRLIGIYRLGVILLDEVIDLLKLLQPIADIIVRSAYRGRIASLAECGRSQKAAGNND